MSKNRGENMSSLTQTAERLVQTLFFIPIVIIGVKIAKAINNILVSVILASIVILLGSMIYVSWRREVSHD